MQSNPAMQAQSSTQQVSKIGSMRIYIPQEDKAWILEKFSDILDSRILTNGKFCTDLEKGLGSYLGVKHVIATNSGTGALEARIKAQRQVCWHDWFILGFFVFPDEGTW